MIEFRPVTSPEDRRWLRWLDAECFPTDHPLRLEDALEWTLAWQGDEPVAFCGWRKHGLSWGFHVRAGVIAKAQGQGLQGEMLTLRERAMKAAGTHVAVTYTEAYSAASMNSLIRAGYRVFEGTPDTRLVINPAYWNTMVYWRKALP